MTFLFGEPKLSNEELSQCLTWLGQHYKITTFQEKEADLYNNALVKYGGSMSIDSSASEEMVKVVKRLVQAATECVSRIDNMTSIPQVASVTHYAWRIVLADYLAWVRAQCAAIEAVAGGMHPRGEYVAELLQKAENSRKKAEKEEQKLLKRMIRSGATMNDFQKLVVNAARAVTDENWQPSQE